MRIRPRPQPLPNDVETLKRLVDEKDALLIERQIEIARLKLEIAILRHQRFGRSSEKLDTDVQQLQLTLEELESTRSEIVSRVVRTKPVIAPESPVRQPLPEHLPREDNVIASPCGCPQCGGKLRYLGTDAAEQLAWRSPFKVIRHLREKFSCSACDTIVQAPLPPRPIERSNADATMLARVLTAKYCEYTPLYRQTEIYARAGIDLPRSTLADWVGASAQLLSPLAVAIRNHVFGADKVHGDDTPQPTLCPGRGTTKEGRLWVYANDDRPAGNDRPPAVWFAYTPDRRQIHPEQHLKDFHGILQCDGYEGFERLCGQHITLGSCWGHARRKFFEIHEADKTPDALEAVERIRILYEIEDQIRGRTADKRATVRQARAGPVLAELRTWLLSILPRYSKKSRMAVAIRYTLSRWPSLTAYVKDGRMEIDNLIAERALRGVAMSRKNSLFVGSDAGGERAAIIFTLVETAKLYGFDPEDYLARVLARIADYPSNRVAELLPWNLIAATVKPAAAA